MVIERRDIYIGGFVALLRLLLVLISTVIGLLALEVVNKRDLLAIGPILLLS